MHPHALHTLILQRKAARLKRRKGQRPRTPNGAEMLYLRDIGTIVAELRTSVRKHVIPELGRIAAKTDGARLDIANPLFDRFQLVTEDLRDITDPKRLKVITGEVGRRVDRFNADDTRRVLGLPIRFGPMAHTIDAFQERNVGLITSIAEEELGRIDELLTSMAGLRVEAIGDAIEHSFDVTESRAQFIARDQTLKLNGEITQARQTQAGVIEYQWSTSHDERVRETHAALDGRACTWLAPPIVSVDGRREHPGRDYQCRCVAIPTIPGFDEA